MGASNVRPAARAGGFYPATADECAKQLAECRAEAPEIPPEVIGERILGGVVPHASWHYSGPTALAVFDALAKADPRPETLILFGACHSPDVDRPSLQATGAWELPTGRVDIDEALAEAMLAEAGSEVLVDRPEAHAGEHAIEVQLPFLQDALPECRFVPVTVPHGKSGSELGRVTAEAVRKLNRPVAAVSSTDLTHYGAAYYGFAPKGSGMEAHRWSKQVNDGAFIEKIMRFDADGAYEVARRDGSACGPAATAAAVAFGKAMGATKPTLLEHVTSWERRKGGEPADFVGYAAIVWV